MRTLLTITFLLVLIDFPVSFAEQSPDCDFVLLKKASVDVDNFLATHDTGGVSSWKKWLLSRFFKSEIERGYGAAVEPSFGITQKDPLAHFTLSLSAPFVAAAFDIFDSWKALGQFRDMGVVKKYIIFPLKTILAQGIKRFFTFGLVIASVTGAENRLLEVGGFYSRDSLVEIRAPETLKDNETVVIVKTTAQAFDADNDPTLPRAHQMISALASHPSGKYQVLDLSRDNSAYTSGDSISTLVERFVSKMEGKKISNIVVVAQGEPGVVLGTFDSKEKSLRKMPVEEFITLLKPLREKTADKTDVEFTCCNLALGASNEAKLREKGKILFPEGKSGSIRANKARGFNLPREDVVLNAAETVTQYSPLGRVIFKLAIAKRITSDTYELNEQYPFQVKIDY